jgi:uncharacterized OsmC-like protein
MELLLLGLGGCAGMDAISLLRKMRQEPSDRLPRRGQR